MTFCLYTNSVSPHQIPLARELVKLLGADNYRYIYTGTLTDARAKLGWHNAHEEWLLSRHAQAAEAEEWLSRSDVLMSGIRDVKLFKERSTAEKRTIYCSERWFKPRIGKLRMLVPSFWKMANAIMDLARRDKNFFLYPIGIHAARDFAWLLDCQIKDFEKFPGGKVVGEGKHLDKMRMWGYYVEPSQYGNVLPAKKPSKEVLRVLWVGRFLGLKRVEDIVRAVSAHVGLKRVGDSLQKITLDLYGSGPEKAKLKNLVSALDLEKSVVFHPPIPIEEVRTLMRSHDVYVLSSNAHEGWGAVVSEALEEGMRVIGTYEAGASATMLPSTCLYHAGDYRKLAELLVEDGAEATIGPWSAANAAKVLLRMMQ